MVWKETALNTTRFVRYKGTCLGDVLCGLPEWKAGVEDAGPFLGDITGALGRVVDGVVGKKGGGGGEVCSGSGRRW